MNIENKVAIVTGVAGGIGKACALALANKGYQIVGMGRSTQPNLSDFDGYSLTYVSGDISDENARCRLFDTAQGNGRITVLVNAAGIAPRVRRDILEMTEESYDEVMNINTKGALFLTQKVANYILTPTIVELFEKILLLAGHCLKHVIVIHSWDLSINGLYKS